MPNLKSAWQAPNRQQNFRTYYTPEGIRVIPREASEEEKPLWEWGLKLERYGMKDQLQAVETAKITASENSVSYERGTMTEWYINGSEGLEQGFTLSQAPVSTKRSDEKIPLEKTEEQTELIVEMSVTGSVTPHLSEKGQRVIFETAEGTRVIDYSKLHVFDAAGTGLPARFALAGLKLSIIVDADGAVYPVTIDPLASTAAWTAESDQANDQFVLSVSGAGDVNGDGYADVIVGAHLYDNGQFDEGAAFVYHGSATGLSSTANWTVESNQANALFG